MMAHSRLNENLRSGIWTEFVSTATKLKNVMVKQYKKNSFVRSSTKRCLNT